MLELIGSSEIAADTYATLARMADDPLNKPQLMAYLADASAPSYELRSVVRALARAIRPRRYLEIGIRLGWSMVQVAAECPDCEIVGIDPWIPVYAKSDNPGSDFLRSELALAAPQHRGGLRILEECSREWLPLNMGLFDLITVDGGLRDRQMISASLKQWKALGTRAWCGYSFSWMAALCARVSSIQATM